MPPCPLFTSKCWNAANNSLAPRIFGYLLRYFALCIRNEV